MGLASRCNLKIPFPSWARDNKESPEQDFENWKEVERWADDFQKNCLPAAGGKIPFLVAASDAHPDTKAVASYQCTGVDDQTVIQQAVDDIYEGDAVTGRVLLSEGTFSLSATVDCYTFLTPGFVEIEGMGAQVTYVEKQSGAGNFWAFTGEGLQGLRNLQINGTFGGVYDLLSNSVVQGCQFWQVGTALFAQTTGEMAVTGNLFYDCGIGISGETLTDSAITGNVFAQSTTADISCTTSSNLAVVGNISTGSAAFFVSDGVEVATGAGNIVDGVLVGGGVIAESDADGERIPIRNAAGAIVGYAGFSDAANDGVYLWKGTAADIKTWATGGFQARTNGVAVIGPGFDTYILVDPNWLYMESSGTLEAYAPDVSIGGGLVRLVNFGAAGVDGTATPSTVAELADVLVDLGIIASHTIP